MDTNTTWDKTREQPFEQTSQTERGPGTTETQGTLRGNVRAHGTPNAEMSGDEQLQGASGGTALADAPIDGQTALDEGDGLESAKLGHAAKGMATKGDSDEIAGSVVDAPGRGGESGQ